MTRALLAASTLLALIPAAHAADLPHYQPTPAQYRCTRPPVLAWFWPCDPRITAGTNDRSQSHAAVSRSTPSAPSGPSDPGGNDCGPHESRGGKHGHDSKGSQSHDTKGGKHGGR